MWVNFIRNLSRNTENKMGRGRKPTGNKRGRPPKTLPEYQQLSNIASYAKKDGTMMIFVNDDYSKNKNQRAKSLGISQRVYTTQMTEGQWNLWNKVKEDFDKSNIKLPKGDKKFEQSLDWGINFIAIDDGKSAYLKYFIEKGGKYLKVTC